jgi:Ribosome-binding factor A
VLATRSSVTRGSKSRVHYSDAFVVALPGALRAATCCGIAVFRDPAGKLRVAHDKMVEAQRKRRIEAEIQRVLSEVIAREVKDPRVGNVTITAVNVAADMGTARVYFTPFASLNPHEEVRIE